MTKDEMLNLWKSKKYLMQTNAKFCEVFALRFASISLSTKLFRDICLSCNYFYHLPPHRTFIVFCLFVSVNRKKNHYFEVQVHKCKGHKAVLAFTLGKAKIVNVIQHTHSDLSIYRTAICFYFISQPCALYIAFDKCFYICDVVVVKSLYIAFLIHKEQFAFKSMHCEYL